MITTHYTASLTGIKTPIRVAAVADLHNTEYRHILRAIEEAQADLIVLPGDFLHDETNTARGFAFLSAAAKHAPTFCSIGNHEVRACPRDLAARVAETGAVLLDNEVKFATGLWIGGLSSGYRPGMQQGRTKTTPPPDRHFIAEFAAMTGPRLLLCHHPEYYAPYLQEKNIPLIVAGHAHGGQWELWGRAIFAPGQGLFPRYTAGFYHDRLIVSRGVSNPHPLIPRIGNPTELVVLDIWPK